MNQGGIKIKTYEGLIPILEYMASTGFPLGVSEISRGLSLNKISVFRNLTILEEAGWVIQEPISQKYKPSEKLFEFSLQIISRTELQKIAGQHLFEINKMTGETVSLTILVGLERVFVLVTRHWEGIPHESEEMIPQWFSIEDIPYPQMWDDARHWLPLVLVGEKFRAQFKFKRDNSTVQLASFMSLQL